MIFSLISQKVSIRDHTPTLFQLCNSRQVAQLPSGAYLGQCRDNHAWPETPDLVTPVRTPLIRRFHATARLAAGSLAFDGHWDRPNEKVSVWKDFGYVLPIFLRSTCAIFNPFIQAIF